MSYYWFFVASAVIVLLVIYQMIGAKDVRNPIRLVILGLIVLLFAMSFKSLTLDVLAELYTKDSERTELKKLAKVGSYIKAAGELISNLASSFAGALFGAAIVWRAERAHKAKRRAAFRKIEALKVRMRDNDLGLRAAVKAAVINRMSSPQELHDIFEINEKYHYKLRTDLRDAEHEALEWTVEHQT